MTNITSAESARNGRAYSISEFKDRDEWMRLLLAIDGSDLIPSAKIVGASVALHHNVKTGRCDPPLLTLAKATGMSVRNVRRMLRILEQSGWLITDQSSGGCRADEEYNANSYVLSVPITRTDVSALNPDNAVRVKEPNPDKRGQSTRTARVDNPDNSVRAYKQANPQAKIQAKRDSRPLDLGDEDSRRRDRSPSPEIDAAFETWWAQVPRKVGKAAAAKLYKRIILARAEATTEQLLLGIQRYGAEVAHREERFIAHPSTWLSHGRWADEPAQPIGNTIDSVGNPVRPPPQASPLSGLGKHGSDALAYARQLAAAKRQGGLQ
jgi:hypothetical protein